MCTLILSCACAYRTNTALSRSFGIRGAYPKRRRHINRSSGDNMHVLCVFTLEAEAVSMRVVVNISSTECKTTDGRTDIRHTVAPTLWKSLPGTYILNSKFDDRGRLVHKTAQHTDNADIIYLLFLRLHRGHYDLTHIYRRITAPHVCF